MSIELVNRDDGSSPEVGKRLAQELITREKVNILLGLVGSPIAAAIAPLTAEAKIPLILTNAAGVAIPRISPTSRVSRSPNGRPRCRSANGLPARAGGRPRRQ